MGYYSVRRISFAPDTEQPEQSELSLTKIGDSSLQKCGAKRTADIIADCAIDRLGLGSINGCTTTGKLTCKRCAVTPSCR